MGIAELRRIAIPPRHALPALAVFAALVCSSFANGGFFPGAWTAVAGGFLWVAALVLLLADGVEFTALERTWLGLFAALIAWTALSSVWSFSSSDSLLEVRRDLVYLAGIWAVFLLARRQSVLTLLGAVWGAATLVVVYALARYLFGARVSSDLFQANLLFRPLGYANGLAIFAGIAALVALVFAARSSSRLVRTAAAASIAPLAVTLELTSSRASVLAVAVGLLAMLAIDNDRRQLSAALVVLAPTAAAIVGLAAQARLTDIASVGPASERRAHLVALWVVLGAVALAFVCPAIEHVRRLVGRVRLRRDVGAAAIAAAALLAVGVAVAADGERFFTTGYRPAYWHVAWAEYQSHPWLGSGAGTFGVYWLRSGNEALQGGALDAHNLYLETLAELGPFGLVLLAAMLAVPLVAAVRARGHAFLSAGVGAYVALLAHASLDWDWELPTVTLAGLVCAAAILLVQREGTSRRELSARARGAALFVTLALALFAVVSQVTQGGALG